MRWRKMVGKRRRSKKKVRVLEARLGWGRKHTGRRAL